MEIARKLEEVGRAMDTVIIRNDLADFLNDPENAQRLNGQVEDVRYALIDYQVRTPESLAVIVFNMYHRHHYNETSTTKAVRS